MNILAVDDEYLALELMRSALEKVAGHSTVYLCRDVASALRTARETTVDVAFLDIHMRGIDGLTLAKKIKEQTPQCNLIFVTGYSEYAGNAMSMHASGYIIKPVSAEAVQAELEDLRHPVTLQPLAF